MITQEQIDNWFSYHKPTDTQQAAYIAIRDAAKVFAAVLVDNSPACADQTVAIHKLREVVMTANASIACDGK